VLFHLIHDGRQYFDFSFVLKKNGRPSWLTDPRTELDFVPLSSKNRTSTPWNHNDLKERKRMDQFEAKIARFEKPSQQRRFKKLKTFCPGKHLLDTNVTISTEQ
jgi:hypothetical protein